MGERDWYQSNYGRITVDSKYKVEKQPRYADIWLLGLQGRLNRIFAEAEQERIDNKWINRLKRWMGL